VSWSPDGRFLAAIRIGGFDLIDIGTEDTIALPYTEGGWGPALRIP
jgi:hypothetical protein